MVATDRKMASGKQSGGDMLNQLDQRVRRVLSWAESVFNPIIARQEQCDQNRNALSVLQNYEFLFNLPKRLGQSTKLKAWDTVIRDYQKARQLFEVTEVEIFASVEKGIEEIATQVRQTLKATLQADQLPTTIEKQVQTISHLEQLGSPAGEPGWFALEQQGEMVVRELGSAADRLEAALAMQTDEASSSLDQSQDFSDVPRIRERQISVSAASETDGTTEVGAKLLELGLQQYPSMFATDANRNQQAVAGRSEIGYDGMQNRKLPRFQFMMQMSHVLTEHLPQLLRLGNEWSAAQDLAISSGLSFVDRDPADVDAMIEESVHMFVDLARNNLFGDDAAADADVRHWLPRCEALIRSTHRTLIALKVPVLAAAGNDGQ